MIDATGFYNSSVVSSSAATSSEPKKDLGKDDFMNLMVVQYQNQNPLEPMKNEDMLAQMAQFSSLEQMKNVASSMEKLSLSQAAATNAQMVNLVGKRVIAEGNKFQVTENGQPIDMKFRLSEHHNVSKIVIKNSDGQVVREITGEKFKTGMNSFTFDGLGQPTKVDGKTVPGEALPAGYYTYSVIDKEGKTITGQYIKDKDGNNTNVKDFAQYGNNLIDSVSFDGSNVVLKSGDIQVNIADVSEVKEK